MYLLNLGKYILNSKNRKKLCMIGAVFYVIYYKVAATYRDHFSIVCPSQILCPDYSSETTGSISTKLYCPFNDF